MKKVLIVEDDKVLSLLLTKMMQKMEISVVGAVTEGREAIRCAKTLNPDLILMDVMLEDDIDGIQAISTLQNDKVNIPVIIVTGNSDAYNRKRADDVEYVDYLVKPINYSILKQSIDKIQN